MIGALFFLIRKSWLNRLKMRVRRLKQPKYLIGAIIGGLYFVGLFGGRLIAALAASRHNPHGFITPENAAMMEALAALILFALIFLAWVLPRERGALVFTEAEVAFLFPAPVSRRTLIHYKLVKSQVAILIMILFFRILFWSSGTVWVRAIGWWVMLSTLNLHNLAASFVRTMLLERGISNWKRRTVVLAVVGAALAGVYVWAKQTVPAPTAADMKGLTNVEYYFQQVTQAGPLPYLLYPFRLVVRPYIEGCVGTFGEFLMALWPALLIMAAHYWWVMRANVAFEEASVEASKRMAERVASMRANRGQWGSKPKKKKRAPFKLKPLGSPAVGLLWKNLIGAGSMFTWRFWLFMAWLMIPVGSVVATSRSTEAMAGALGFMITMFVGLSFLVGPQMVRQDFRRDLAMGDVLKTYPIKGWQMALGELLAPAVILTGFQWVLLVLAVSLTSKWADQQIGLGIRLAIASAVAVIAPGLNLVLLLIPNAAVLVFPGWFQTGKDAQQGIEVMGQRIVFMIGTLVAVVVALAPAAVLFGGVYFAAQFFLGPITPVPLAALAAAAGLITEAAFGLVWLGKLFEKYDVAEITS